MNQFMPAPFQIGVPHLSQTLGGELRERRSSMVWKVRSGQEVEEEATIAEFQIDWKKSETKEIIPEIRTQVLTAAIVMPFRGVVCSLSMRHLFTFRPYLTADHLSGDMREIAEWVRGCSAPSRVYNWTTQAIWLLMNSKGVDANEIINSEINKLKSEIIRDF